MTATTRPRTPTRRVPPAHCRGQATAAKSRVQAQAAARIATALSTCPSLSHASPEQESLWLAVQDGICTTGLATILPLGSRHHVTVDAEYAGDELAAAMHWLVENETEARALSPLELFVRLRGEATRGRFGSARLSQADSLHGLTHVPPGRPVRFVPLDEQEAI